MEVIGWHPASDKNPFWGRKISLAGYPGWLVCREVYFTLRGQLVLENPRGFVSNPVRRPRYEKTRWCHPGTEERGDQESFAEVCSIPRCFFIKTIKNARCFFPLFFQTRVRCRAGCGRAHCSRTLAQAELCSPSALGFQPFHRFWPPVGASSVPHIPAEDEVASQSSETLCHSRLPGADGEGRGQTGFSPTLTLLTPGPWLVLGRWVSLEGLWGPLVSAEPWERPSPTSDG